MKRNAFFYAAILLIASVAYAQTKPPQPGSEHKKMLIWVGNWTFTEEARDSASAPWDKVAVSCQNRPLGGFFVEARCKINTKGREINHVEIFAFDPLKKTHVTSFFNSDGGSGGVTSGAYVDNKWEFKYTSVDANAKSLEARCSWIFGPDAMSISGSCERLTDGKWDLFRKLTGTKTKATK